MEMEENETEEEEEGTKEMGDKEPVGNAHITALP
jgi:hypothetical protein